MARGGLRPRYTIMRHRERSTHYEIREDEALCGRKGKLLAYTRPRLVDCSRCNERLEQLARAMKRFGDSMRITEEGR